MASCGWLPQPLEKVRQYRSRPNKKAEVLRDLGLVIIHHRPQAAGDHIVVNSPEGSLPVRRASAAWARTAARSAVDW